VAHAAYGSIAAVAQASAGAEQLLRGGVAGMQAGAQAAVLPLRVVQPARALLCVAVRMSVAVRVAVRVGVVASSSRG
jgi:hypothetical protein